MANILRWDLKHKRMVHRAPQSSTIHPPLLGQHLLSLLGVLFDIQQLFFSSPNSAIVSFWALQDDSTHSSVSISISSLWYMSHSLLLSFAISLRSLAFRCSISNVASFSFSFFRNAEFSSKSALILLSRRLTICFRFFFSFDGFVLSLANCVFTVLHSLRIC